VPESPSKIKTKEQKATEMIIKTMENIMNNAKIYKDQFEGKRTPKYILEKPIPSLFPA
jgi:hypothetical protein